MTQTGRTATPAAGVTASAGAKRGGRVPRPLHPIAWWLWAVGLAVAASRTTNPLLLGLILAGAGWVVARRRVEAPWARAFRWYLGMALVVLAIRVVFRAVFGGGTAAGEHVLLTLPQLPLPTWAAGVRLGGPVSAEATLAAAVDGLRPGTLLCCVGAANALANPKRALRSLPGALEELGVAVVVAVTVAPQLVESVGRVRRARRLRAGETRRWRVVRSVVIPVLEDALERSLLLAAAMDSRGFGRRAPSSRARRRAGAGLLYGGLFIVCVGLYGLLDPGAPPAMGLPLVAAGALACGAGLAFGRRRAAHSRYRPDSWRLPELAVVACGALPAATLLAGVGYRASALHLPFSPLGWPALPLVPAAAILVGALPGFLAPPPPVARRAARPTPVPAPMPVARPLEVPA